MARSINFNTTDMSTHNLIITSSGFNILRQLSGLAQLQDKGYAFRPIREPRRIRVECSVTGTSRADLDNNLDNIRIILTELVPKNLIFDVLNTRYFLAVLQQFEGRYLSATLFEGSLYFTCPDPLGYNIAEDNHNHNITAVETTIDEPVAGTGYVDPVYTLTSKNNLVGATIKVENLTTDEELVWVGDLAIDATLVIDVARWLVSEGAVASMATVTGKFPRLKPNTTNQIKVTGLWTTDTGNLNIKYRDAFL